MPLLLKYTPMYLLSLEQCDWTLFDPLTDKFGECEAPSFQKLRFSLSALALPWTGPPPGNKDIDAGSQDYKQDDEKEMGG